VTAIRAAEGEADGDEESVGVGDGVTDDALEWPLAPGGPQREPARRVHVVVAGDTLARLAQHYYGDAGRWPEIAERNQVSDPAQLQIGQRLTIP
jgi:nucleoid-associated protein YgaU